MRSSAARKQRLQVEYKKALRERRSLLAYVDAAKGILSEAEMQLLAEFAQIAKRKCERLRRAIQPSTPHAA